MRLDPIYEAKCIPVVGPNGTISTMWPIGRLFGPLPATSIASKLSCRPSNAKTLAAMGDGRSSDTPQRCGQSLGEIGNHAGRPDGANGRN